MKKIHLLITFGLFLPFIFNGFYCFGQGVEIETDGSITMSGTATIEIVDGGFTNDGTYAKATETVTFSGTTAGVISGTNTTDFYNLTNSNSGGVTINSGAAVTVSNDFNNTGAFSIDSDATGSGSFIVQGTSTGNITYDRYMTGVDKWHLIASPVSGQDINELVVTNVGSNAVATNDTRYGLAPYDNSVPDWGHYTTSSIGSAGNFVAAKGYEILRTADGTVSFSGALYTADQTIGITTGSNNWNLVGNPFTSALNANEDADADNNFLGANISEFNASYGAIYIWDAASSSYITVNQTTATYITAGQSFFVYSADGGGTVSFTEAMQTHQTNATLLKKSNRVIPTIKLFAKYSNGTSSTNIKYIENMTTGLDQGYDAGRFSGGDNSFAVYSHLVNDIESKVDFDIQCLPYGEFDHVIPLGLNAPANSEIVFHVEVENLPSDVPVYLEDKVKETFTALHETGMSYSVNITDQIAGIGRFYLHTKAATTGLMPSPGNESEFIIISRPGQNRIHIIGNVDSDTQVGIYDISGRQLKKTSINNTISNDVNMAGFKSGVYIVTIRSAIQQTSKKIHWIKQ